MPITRKALAAYGFILVLIGMASTGIGLTLVYMGFISADESFVAMSWLNTVPIGIAAFLAMLFVKPTPSN